MMMSLRMMWTCHWAARRIQRYLDADPDALLDPAEARRLEAHLVECERCAGRAGEYRALSRALAEWSTRGAPDPQIVARLHRAAERLISEGGR